MLKKVSIEFNKRATLAIEQIASTSLENMGPLHRHASQELLKVVKLCSKVAHNCLSSFTKAILDWGVSKGMQEYCALRVLNSKGKKAGISHDEENANSEFRRMLLAHYISAESLFLVLRDNLTSDLAKDIARPIEEIAFQFHMTPPPPTYVATERQKEESVCLWKRRNLTFTSLENPMQIWIWIRECG